MADEVPSVSGRFAPGTRIADYELAEQVGWGGMAAVYRARDVRLDRWVALKILAPEIARDDPFRQRFISESRAAAAVDHPNIIPVVEAGEAGGVLFIAMRYVGGGDLRTLYRELGPLSAARVTGIIAQVASALDAAHAAGLVHRDVKPANMLLAEVAWSGRPDHVYLTDFGLSKQSVSAPLTLTGQFMGTLDYMAPEQIESRPGDSRPVDGRADQYALACSAFEMLCGVPPFERGQDLGLLFDQLSAAPPSLAARRPDLPAAIDLVMARALARSPDDRYDSCLDFAAALSDACGLEWGASGRLMPGAPRAITELALPLTAAAPPATAGPPGAPGPPRVPGPPGTPGPSDLPGAPGPPVATDLPEAAPDLPGTPGTSGAPDSQRPPGSQRPPARRNPVRHPAWTLAQPVTRQPGVTGGARPASAEAGLAAGGLGAGGLDAIGLGPRTPAPGSSAPTRLAEPYPPARRGRSRRRLLAAAAVAVVVLGLAAGAFALLGGSGPAPGAAGRSSSATNAPASSAHAASTAHGKHPKAAARGPAGTVKAYIAAINRHDYAAAWNLGGRNGPASYPEFVQGFSATARDTLTIVSVSGDVVTVQLSAVQTSGAVMTFQGTYTVQDGVITGSAIKQTS